MADSITFKVLVVGPFGVGKTTFIQHISSVPVVGTEAPTTGEEAGLKQTTTVGIEYGVFTVADEDMEVTLLLFGTPGQERFSDVREIASRGIDGLIVLVDGTDPPTWSAAADLHEAFNPGGLVPTVVAVNRWPDGQDSPAGMLESLRIDVGVTVVHGQVVDLDDARRFLIELLSEMLDREVPDDDWAAMETV